MEISWWMSDEWWLGFLCSQKQTSIPTIPNKRSFFTPAHIPATKWTIPDNDILYYVVHIKLHHLQQNPTPVQCFQVMLPMDQSAMLDP